MPDLVQVAKDIEAFGANGITVHPRPDERHIRYDDVRELRAVVKTELNVEGNPKEIDLLIWFLRCFRIRLHSFRIVKTS